MCPNFRRENEVPTLVRVCCGVVRCRCTGTGYSGRLSERMWWRWLGLAPPPTEESEAPTGVGGS